MRGGAADASIWEKMVAAEKLANEYEIPLVRFIEGTGGGGSVKSLEKQGFTYVPFNPGWDKVIENLSKIPVISLALGPVAGLGAARLVSSHYSIMVRKVKPNLCCWSSISRKDRRKSYKRRIRRQ